MLILMERFTRWFYPVSRISKYLKKMEAIIDIGDSNYILIVILLKLFRLGHYPTIMIPHYLDQHVILR